MSHFLQLHFLTPFPPSNLNRDDLGRPKTALVGGRPRLRISSQCLKRTWRTSDEFAKALQDEVGTRSKSLGKQLLPTFLDAGVDEKVAQERIGMILKKFGKVQKKNPLMTEQLVHFSPSEIRSVEALVETLANEDRDPEESELGLLTRDDQAADVAMFGRMLAASPELNVDAAVQVSHAFTVNEVTPETDFFTAVDDLSAGRDETGSGHMGELEFGAGLFYTYVCVDLQQLRDNLATKDEVRTAALKALVRAAATTAPSGKQNSFASRARASWIRAELGDAQPRSLAAAYFKPISDGSKDLIGEAIKQIEFASEKLDASYGPCADSSYSMNAVKGTGTFSELLEFVEEGAER